MLFSAARTRGIWDELLQAAQSKQVSDVPMAFQNYEWFLLKGLAAIAGGISKEVKTKIIDKLVHKVELKPDRVLVHFYGGISLLQGELLPKGVRLLKPLRQRLLIERPSTRFNVYFNTTRRWNSGGSRGPSEGYSRHPAYCIAKNAGGL